MRKDSDEAVSADNPDEVLWGATKIGAYINCNSVKAFYLLQKGRSQAAKSVTSG